MNLFFSDKPGAHERHLRRKVNNPLFGDVSVTQEDIQRAREEDEKELRRFLDEFHAIANDASQLDASAEADLLIGLKQRLEKSYECSCGVMGSQEEIQTALSKLIDSIMNTLMHSAVEDVAAQQKLTDEHHLRQKHFDRLGYDLVADLLRVDSPINPDDLVPALLSAPAQAARAAVSLFTDEQQALLFDTANKMLADVSSEHPRIIHAKKILLMFQSGNDHGGIDTEDELQGDSGSLAS